MELVGKDIKSQYDNIPNVQEVRGKTGHVKERCGRYKKDRIKFLNMKTTMFELKKIHIYEKPIALNHI